MSDGVGLFGENTETTGAIVSRTTVTVERAAFPGVPRWNQSTARTVTSFCPSVRASGKENTPSAPVTTVDAPIVTVAPPSVRPEIVAVGRRVNRRDGPSRTRPGACVSTTIVCGESTPFPTMSAVYGLTVRPPSATALEGVYARQ